MHAAAAGAGISAAFSACAGMSAWNRVDQSTRRQRLAEHN
jgi:hypothetical protein